MRKKGITVFYQTQKESDKEVERKEDLWGTIWENIKNQKFHEMINLYNKESDSVFDV